MLETLTAKRDTTLVIRPVQSAVLAANGLPDQLYRVRRGTVLECVTLEHWEGKTDERGEKGEQITDGDDYYWVQLPDPLPDARPLNYFAFKAHWAEQHPPMRDEPAQVISEDKKLEVAKAVKAASATALAEPPTAQRIEDLGAVIKLPGKAFERARHLYEPVGWIGGKPLPFTWSEFTKNGTRVPQTESIALNIIKCAQVLAAFRTALAQPLIITSGYRDPRSNRNVGGASASRHLVGDAADWHPKRDGITREVWELACRIQQGGGLAISAKDNRPEIGFIHTDCRGGGDPLRDRAGRTFWTYSSMVPSWGHGR
jgi:hypothetical protein